MPFTKFPRLTARIIACLFIFVSPTLVSAQNLSVQKPTSITDQEALRVTRDQVQADRKPLVAKAMNLTDDEARVFWPIYD